MLFLRLNTFYSKAIALMVIGSMILLYKSLAINVLVLI